MVQRSPPNTHNSKNSNSNSHHNSKNSNHNSSSSSSSHRSPSTSSPSSYVPQLFSCFGGGRLSRSISFRYSQRNSSSTSSTSSSSLSSSSSSSQRKKVFCLDGESEGREDEEQQEGGCECEGTFSFHPSNGRLDGQQGLNETKKIEREIDPHHDGRKATEKGGGGEGVTSYRCDDNVGYINHDEKNRSRTGQRDHHTHDSYRYNSKKKELDAQVQDDCLQEGEQEIIFSSPSSVYKKNGCQTSASQRGYVENRSEEMSDEDQEESDLSGKNGLPPWSIVMRRTEATPLRRRRAGSRLSLSPRCSSSVNHCHSAYQSVVEERRNGEDESQCFFEKRRNGEKGERSSIWRRGGDKKEEDMTEDEDDEEDDPWKQAIKRKDEYMTFDDFKAM